MSNKAPELRFHRPAGVEEEGEEEDFAVVFVEVEVEAPCPCRRSGLRPQRHLNHNLRPLRTLHRPLGTRACVVEALRRARREWLEMELDLVPDRAPLPWMRPRLGPRLYRARV